MALAFSTKAFSVSGPPVWNSLSYQCRSAELFSSFRRVIKTELFDIAYSERKQSAYCPPVCASDSLATHGAIQIYFDWLIDRLNVTKYGQQQQIMIYGTLALQHSAADTEPAERVSAVTNPNVRTSVQQHRPLLYRNGLMYLQKISTNR